MEPATSPNKSLRARCSEGTSRQTAFRQLSAGVAWEGRRPQTPQNGRCSHRSQKDCSLSLNFDVFAFRVSTFWLGFGCVLRGLRSWNIAF